MFSNLHTIRTEVFKERCGSFSDFNKSRKGTALVVRPPVPLSISFWSKNDRLWNISVILTKLCILVYSYSKLISTYCVLSVVYCTFWVVHVYT